MAACIDDSDCPGAEVCYTNLTWTSSPLCDCSHYYGGQGLNCAELSLQSYINASLVGLTMAVLLLLLVVTAVTDVRVGYFRHRVFKFDNTTLTWAYCIMGMICLFIWSALVFASAVEPSKNGLILEGQVIQKLSPYGLEERVFISLAIFFTMTASLNISISWVDVANMTRRFQQSSKGLLRYKQVIRVVQVVWLVVLIVQLALGLTIVVIATGVVVALGCLVTYVVARVKFIRVLQESLSRSGSKKGGMRTDEDKRISRVLNLIRTTSSGVIVGIGLIFGIAVVMVPISLNWQEYGRPGGASAYATLLHSLIIAFMIVLAAIMNYCHRMFDNSIRNKMDREQRRIEASSPSYVMSNLTTTTKAQGQSSTKSVEESI